MNSSWPFQVSIVNIQPGSLVCFCDDIVGCIPLYKLKSEVLNYFSCIKTDKHVRITQEKRTISNKENIPSYTMDEVIEQENHLIVPPPWLPCHTA
jgi:hypothetical protein